ncbi:ribonucleoside-diphosphate reductase [Bacteroides clarus CAG:160]|nr:ribonucleoside-diphosphate reductase [Bacteroides clarus CAG:160]
MEKKIYSYDEAYEESLRYFQGDELAARVWVNKYAVKDSFGNIYEKSPEDMQNTSKATSWLPEFG